MKIASYKTQYTSLSLYALNSRLKNMRLITGLAASLVLSLVFAQNDVDPELSLNPCDLRCGGNIFRRTYYVRNFNGGACIASCVRFPRVYIARGYSCGRCPKQFDNYNELKLAVDAYLDDNSASSAIATTYGHPIGMWQVQKVQEFEYLFDGKRNPAAATFNEDISAWRVSSATNMQYMFASNTAFNRDIGGWDVSRVTTMEGMFEDASSFNKNIGSWDVSNVGDMSYMFDGASKFAQNLNSWDVSSVTDMENMFSSAVLFNAPIGTWNVSKVNNFARMFADAEAFSQDLCPWGDHMTSVTSQKVIDMFISTQCLLENSPALSETPISPLCFNCRKPGGR